MHFVVALLLVTSVHLATGAAAWTQVGLLADDHEVIGAAILRHRGAWTFESIFAPEVPPDSVRALYRPFIELGFWLEQPWFGAQAFGYHVVNSMLHCATALLWFQVLRRLSGSVALALAAAVAFVGWPGHSEATHWIAARTSPQSGFFLTGALLVLDVAMAHNGRSRAALLWLAAAAAVLAIGSKESAVLVLPLAAVLAWHRARTGGHVLARALAALRAVAPMLLACFLWLAWRAHVLGTWGSGRNYGWKLQRITTEVCGDWAAVLVAPVHSSYVSPAWTAALWLLHGSLLLAASWAWRAASIRSVLGLGVVLVLLGYVAGIGLEPLDLGTLQNVRYTYEASLGLAALFGLGIAMLPLRARGAALAVLVLAHAIVLDGNRRSWLRAARVYEHLEHEIGQVASTTQQPIRVVDAPGVYEGAFALLNGFTEFKFMQAFAPPGANLRGAVSSTQEWEAVLRELAAAAAARQPLVNTYTVGWNDGALVPLELDASWPREVWPGTTICYARVARTRPFAGSLVPVHVLVQTRAGCELQVQARCGDRSLPGSAARVAAGNEAQAIVLSLRLPEDIEVGRDIEFECIVRGGEVEARYGLGRTTAVLR